MPTRWLLALVLALPVVARAGCSLGQPGSTILVISEACLSSKESTAAAANQLNQALADYDRTHPVLPLPMATTAGRRHAPRPHATAPRVHPKKRSPKGPLK